MSEMNGANTSDARSHQVQMSAATPASLGHQGTSHPKESQVPAPASGSTPVFQSGFASRLSPRNNAPTSPPPRSPNTHNGDQHQYDQRVPPNSKTKMEALQPYDGKPDDGCESRPQDAIVYGNESSNFSGGGQLGGDKVEGGQAETMADLGGMNEGIVRDISSFSPYAPRLGGGQSLEDEVAGVVSRLERVYLGGQNEDEPDQLTPRATREVSSASAAASGEVDIARRMQFSQDSEAAVTSSHSTYGEINMAVVEPQLRPVVSDSNAAALSHGAATTVAGVPDCSGLQKVGDGQESTPTAEEKRTLVVYPPECLLHMGGEGYEGHQETPKRLELLCGEAGALRRDAFRGLEWADPSRVEPAMITDLLRVHEYEYLLHIQERCKEAPSAIAPKRAPAVSALAAECSTSTSKQHPASDLGNDVGCGSGGPPGVSAMETKTDPLDTVGNAPRTVPTNSKAGATVAAVTASSTACGAKNAVGVRDTAHGNVSNNGRADKGSKKDSVEFGQRFAPDAGYVDVDTRVSRESYAAAKMAAGAVILAVDRVVQGKNPNAFVAVRPPGHHAGPSGSVPSTSFWKNPGMNSSGFCLLNNAAIGAAYARSRYGRSGVVSRVAIVDIDIHHGNGTEEIVRCLNPMTTRLPLPPSWPPMTKTVYKPWLNDGDADNVFFGSVSLQDKDSFYPASGTEEERFDENHNIVNVSLSALGPSPGEEAKKRALTKTKMTEYTKKAGSEFKQKCRTRLLSRLKDFSPDLLIISAGFDGHVEDYYHYLSNETYEWITLALEECCPSGRIVSVLEGGYSLEARTSRSKQARAKSKPTVKADALTASATTAVSSGHALRERRTRPATRRNAPSAAAAAGSNTGNPGSSVATVPIKNKSQVPTVTHSTSSPDTASEPCEPGSATATSGAMASLSVRAPNSDDRCSTMPAPQAQLASAGKAENGPGSMSQTGPRADPGCVPRTPLDPIAIPNASAPQPLAVTSDSGIAAVPSAPHGFSVSAVAPAYDAALGKSSSELVNPAGMDAPWGGVRPGLLPAVKRVPEEEQSLLRACDGGLVRGVVSHVAALMVASERRSKG